MKTFEFTASVLFNTNRVVSTTEETWESIRPNSYIKIGDDEAFYSVGKIEPLFYVKDFKKNSSNQVSINGDIDINLLEGDCVNVSFKEFELLTVFNCSKTGSGYKTGETITVSGGKPITDNITGHVQTMSFIITKTDDNGGILQIQLSQRGRYYVAPEREAEVSGGSGSGATILIECRAKDERTIVERTIIKMDKNSAGATLTFDAPIPEGVEDGKLSANKWQMFLTSTYAGDTKINQKYTITRDFTPFLNIPLLVKGSSNPEAIYNLSMNILDKRFKELADKLEKR